MQRAREGGDEKVGRWNPVGNTSVGQYHHAAVPLGNHGTAWLVAGGCVRDDPMGDENHEKCPLQEMKPIPYILLHYWKSLSDLLTSYHISDLLINLLLPQQVLEHFLLSSWDA